MDNTARKQLLVIATQDVFPMVHTLTIVEPIWPMFQNLSKTLIHMYNMMLGFSEKKSAMFKWSTQNNQS